MSVELEFIRVSVQSQAGNWERISDLIAMNRDHFELESVNFSGWRADIVMKIFSQEGYDALEYVIEEPIDTLNSDTLSAT